MNTPEIINNTAAPSVTIAPRSIGRGVPYFVVTLTTGVGTTAYPCRTVESATKLAERFIAGVTKSSRPAQAQPAPELVAA
jgi:hypothetical protein